MTNREQLYENYEDALFAILMDDLAETEGERLLELNQQLQDDPDAAIPDEVRQRCIAVINREFAKKKRAASVQRAKKALKILPWAVVIAMALMAIAFAAFPSFRTGVLNIIKATSNDHTSWSFQETYHSYHDDLPISILLPEDFIMIDQYNSPDIIIVHFQSAINSEAVLSASVFKGQNAVVGIDNENYNVKSICSVQGFNADLYKNDTDIWVTWADPTVPCCISIEASNVDENTIMQAANSIVIQQA